MGTAERDVIPSLIRILLVFKETTQDLSADRTPTMHLLVELIEQIRHTATKLHSDRNLNDTVRPLLEYLVKHLNHQFSFSKDRSPLELMALALNPSVIYMMDTKDEKWAQLAAHIRTGLELLREYPIETLRMAETNEPSHPLAKPAATTFSSSTRSRLPAKDCASSTVRRLNIVGEVERYLSAADRVPFTSEDSPSQLLKWWRQNELAFPILSCVALRVLPIPASQAHSERVFSKLGCTSVSSRAALDPVTESKLVTVRACGLTHGASRQQDSARAVSEEELSALREGIKQARRRKKFAKVGPLPAATQDLPALPLAMDVDEMALGEQNYEADMRFGADEDSDSDSSECASESDDDNEDDDDDSSGGPRMLLTAPQSQAVKLVAYFENVDSDYVPDWKAIFGASSACFTKPIR